MYFNKVNEKKGYKIMKKAKTLKDVVLIMYDNSYDFIGEDVKTLGSQGKHRKVLLFEHQLGARFKTENKKEIKALIGNLFTVESYNSGRYYQIYKTL